MTREEILRDFRTRFAGDILEFVEKSPKRVYVEIKPESIKKAALFLFKDLGARFNIASGVDARGRLEILYHFTLEDINVILSLRVKLPKASPEIDSITPLFEAANWVEREIHELLGINFRGHPDMRKLLLPDNWPEGVYPLRRDYKEWDPTAIRDRGV
jgi:Ni,Fe-hydrogenase III component G